AACGRDHFRYRLAVLGGDLVELRVQLNAWLAAIPSRGVSHISDASGEAFRPGGTPQAAIASAQDWAELAARYRAGEEVDWAACYRGLQLRRVLVPGHPFERQSYMVQPASSSASEATRYRLLWIPELALPHLPDRMRDAWLVLGDRPGWADALCATLAERGARTTCIYCRPARNGGGHMAPDDGPALHAAIEKAGPLRGIIHLWGLEAPPAAELDAVGLMKAQRYTVAS